MKPTPHPDTFSAVPATQLLCKWIRHLTWLMFLSPVLSGFLKFLPYHRNTNKWVYFPALATNLGFRVFRRIRGQKRRRAATLHVNGTWQEKWKVMRIGDLITSIPLLHPEASSVSLERFSSSFGNVIIISLSFPTFTICHVEQGLLSSSLQTCTIALDIQNKCNYNQK